MQAFWNGPTFIALVVVDYLVDLYFVSDTVLNAYSLRGEYLKSAWFLLDVLSVVPVDVFLWNPVLLHFALRCNRFIRLANVPNYIFKIERYSKKAMYVSMLKLAAALVLLANLFASAKIGISYVEGFGLNDWVLPKSDKVRSTHRLYYEGFWWAWHTISGVGGGNATPETDLEKGIMIAVGLIGKMNG